VAQDSVNSRAIVGLFVLVTLGILAWGTLQLGGFGFQRAEGYPLIAIFDSAYGVEPQTPVLIAGIKVGEVTSVELYNKKARLTMKFLKGVQVRADAKALIKTAGIIGEKFIEVEPGSDDQPLLLPGETIQDVTSPPDFEKLAEKLSEIAVDVKAVTESLRYALGDRESRESLRNTVLSLERISREVEGAIRDNREGVSDIVTSVRSLVMRLEQQGPDLIDNFNQVALDARGFMAGVSDTIADVKPRVDQGFDRIDSVLASLDDAAKDIRDITDRVNKGEGTVGKLLNDPETAEKLNNALTGVNEVLRQVSDLKTSVHYRGEYRFNETNINRLVPRDGDRPGGIKSYFGLKVQPKQDKFYSFEIVNDPIGRVEQKRTIIRDAQGNVVNNYLRTDIKDRIEFSAQIAKNVYGLTLRGGIIENSGGVGLDYAIIDPNLRVSVQAFDFTKPDNPNLKANLDFIFFRHFFITVGAEDLINSQYDPLVFGGGGLFFDDDDLKLLLSTLPTP
jgi:phospholipid/cholesterol/gamma-HCH transport system substrate-binding protein